MSGLLACVQVVGREAAAAARAEAEAAEHKSRKKDRKEKKKARKAEHKARKAAKRKAGEDGGGGKRVRRSSGSDASSSSDDSDGDVAPPDARTAAGMDWMSNPAHQSAPRAAPVDDKAVAEAKAQKERDERRLVRPRSRLATPAHARRVSPPVAEIWRMPAVFGAKQARFQCAQ